MSFDIEPDGDIHGECAEEIQRLQSEVAELRKERDDLIMALKKSDDEYLTLRKECDDLKRALSSMSIYAVELEQRLAGQVPSHAAVGDEARPHEIATESFLAGVMWSIENPGSKIGDWISEAAKHAKSVIVYQTAPTSAGVPDERGSQYLTDDELADPEYMRAYVDELHSIIRSIAKNRPASEATTTQLAADGGATFERFATDIDALEHWTLRLSYNDSYVGEPEGEFKRRIRSLSKLLDQIRSERVTRPTSEATTQLAADGGGE